MKRKRVKVRIANPVQDAKPVTKTDGQKENSYSEPDVSPCFNCSPEARMACCGCEKGIEWERTHKKAVKDDEVYAQILLVDWDEQDKKAVKNDEVYTPIVRPEEPCPCLKCSPEFRAACCGCEKGRKWEQAHKRAVN